MQRRVVPPPPQKQPPPPRNWHKPDENDVFGMDALSTGWDEVKAQLPIVWTQ